jgi:very-short-patch-repair endonuclease
MRKNVNISREELFDLYVSKSVGMARCAEVFGCSSRTIQLRLQEYNIPIRTPSEAGKVRQPRQSKRPPDEVIKQWYDAGGAKEISRQGKVHLAVAYQWMKHAGIKAPGHGRDAPPKEELEQVYKEKKTFAKVGQHYGVVAMTAKKWLKQQDIETHTGPHAWAGPTKDELLLLKQHHSWVDIAKQYGVSFTAMRTLCIRYGIEIDPRPHKIRNLPTQSIVEMYLKECRSMIEIGDLFGVGEGVVRRYLAEAGIQARTAGYTSAAEREIDTYVQSLGFSTKKIKPITRFGKMELDIVVEDAKLVIEYCGLYWHSEHPAHGLARGSDYHHRKLLHCEEQGWRLITIFEDEWVKRKSQIKAFIGNALGRYDRRLQGRKTTVRMIEPQVARQFCHQYHWQGAYQLHVRHAAGLYDKDELVGVMTFAPHHRFEDRMTLNRLCFKAGVLVVGGASKLLAALRKVHSGPILSWSDNRYSQGRVYEALGFVMEQELPPDYSYTQGRQPASRKSKQSMQKSSTGCPPEITEKDWCAQQGWYRIWDCGKKRWRLS